MPYWPKYQSHKIVEAMPITGISPGGAVVVGPRHEAFYPTEAGMASRAEVGDYAIVYPDGFKSISPKAAFEDGYTRLP